MLRHCSSVRSMKAWRPPPPMPALAKQPSTRPKCPAWPHRGLDRSGVGDVANPGVDLAGAAGHGAAAGCSSRRCGPRSRRCIRPPPAPARCRPDAAIAAGDDGDAAGEVENGSSDVSIGLAQVSRVRWRSVFDADHGQAPPKNQICSATNTAVPRSTRGPKTARKPCSSSTSRSTLTDRSRS